MGSTRSHPLPPGIFVKMSSSSSEFDGWTDRELVSEINRLRELLAVHDECKEKRETAPVDDEEYDSDDIMNDPDVREMVNNGEHTCHMFDGECRACQHEEDEEDEEDEEEYDGEVRVMTEEEVQNNPEMTAQVDKVDELRAHFC